MALQFKRRFFPLSYDASSFVGHRYVLFTGSVKLCDVRIVSNNLLECVTPENMSCASAALRASYNMWVAKTLENIDDKCKK